MMKTKLTLLLILLVFAFSEINKINAQPQYYNYNTTSNSNSFPFNVSGGKEVQWIYLAGDFNQPTPAPSGNITSISFFIATTFGPTIYTNLIIKMGQTSAVALPSGSFYTGSLTVVYNKATVSLSGVANQWMTITLDNPFTYDPTMSLILEVQQCGITPSGGSIYQSTLSGNRRSYSTSSCPVSYSGQDGTCANLGLNITTTPTAVPVAPWTVVIGLLFIAAFTFYRLRKRIKAYKYN
jgi:hypothetical protein